VQTVWKEVLGLDIATGFPRLSWHQAMMRYGSDKPDLRYGLEIQTITEMVRNSGFAVFDDVTAAGGHVACLAIPAGAGWSRKGFDELTEHAKVYGAKGMAWMKVTAEGVQSPIAKFLSPDTVAGIVGASGAAEGDAVVIISDADFERCYTILGALRREIARRTGLLAAAQGSYAMLWVTEFPLLEFSPEEKRYVARHHPFTSPLPDDVSMLDSNPAGARAQAYDLVINGYETAGGSIRIHDGAVQQRMFDLLGISREEADQKFGFLLKALSYGAPPHGGIAFGMDRLTMIVAGTENIRDVVAYPKTTSATSLMDNAPSPVAAAQLAELGIAPAKKNDK
jgi:aspartyl-tRNA synthetase